MKSDAKANRILSKRPRKMALNMTTAELEQFTKRFDREHVPSRSLTKKQRQLHDAAKRRPGRPKVGQGAERVLVSIERGLLQQADTYCQANDLKRAELIAMGLRKVMK